jgi:hypothetical protein
VGVEGGILRLVSIFEELLECKVGALV